MTTVLREPFNSLSAWSSLNTFVITPSGRTGSAASSVAGGTADFTIPVAARSDWLTFGFAVRLQPDFANMHELCFLTTVDSFNNTIYQTELIANTDRSLQLWTPGGGFATVATAPNVIPVDAWCYVEAQVRLHATLGECKLRVNGVQLASATGINTYSGSGDPVWAKLIIYGGVYSGQVQLFDDLYIKSGAGETFSGDIAFAPEGRSSHTVTRVAFNDPRIDWYRASRASARVAFSEPPAKDWYRSGRQSVRIAFTGATTAARVGAFEARILLHPGAAGGGNALVGAFENRVLRVPTGGNALVGAFETRVLRPLTAPEIHFWDGAAYISGPAALWDGTTYRPAYAVRLWNGSTWVDAP